MLSSSKYPFHLLPYPHDFRKRPDFQPATGKGLGACGKGNLDEAIAAIKKAIELDPRGALYYTELSRLYVQEGMVPEVEAEGVEAMRLQRGW